MATKIIKSPHHVSVNSSGMVFNFSLRVKYILLTAIGLIFYGNSLFNKYALDDNLVILNNDYVQMGFAGIPKLLTHDSYTGYFNHMGFDPSKQLSGGRFRPLSEIIFATEHQLFGSSILLPHFCHLVNILAYVVCLLVLFHFLEKYLLKKIPGGSDVAFLSSLLFAIHPLHTEVVANIKSLDEILSLLFITLTFVYSLKYNQNKQTKHLIMGVISFFLALLAKEYAITLLFFIPFLFYLLKSKKPMSAIMATIPYYTVFTLYLIIRYNAVGFHHVEGSAMPLNNNPYLYATHAQKIATEWFVLGKYLGLLFFPYPLSCDYSYYQIPYHNFSDISVLFSIVIYLTIFTCAIRLALKKNVLSFAIFFFLLNIFLISNFVMDIGATMGERLVFHSSLGFVIILSFYTLKAAKKLTLQNKKNIIMGTLSVIGVVCFGETVTRNAQWKDDSTLFIHDVQVVPNSFLANNNAGWFYISLSEKKENAGEAKAYLDFARKCLFKALHLNQKSEFTYRDLGVMYVDEGILDSAQYCYDMVEKLHPNFPELKSNYAILGQRYFAKGLNLAKQDNPSEGILYMKKALLIDSTNESIWYDIGIAYYHIHRYDSERYALMKTLQLKPDSFDAAGAKRYLQELSQMKKQ